VLGSIAPFIVIGITVGSLYGLAAIGLVLTYQTTGIFNFAHGAIGALAVYVFYFLHTQHNVSWPLAAVVCLGILAPAMGLALERIARSMAHVAEIYKVTATVGLILIVVAIGNIWYGNVTTLVPSFLPNGSFEIFGVFIGWDQALIVLAAIASAALLYVFFRYRRLGVAMRAAVDSPELLGMFGTNTIRVQQAAWITGAMFASMAGILLAPQLGLNGIILTQLVVQAFGAAAVGRLTSLPLTYLGGLVIGILAALGTDFSSVSWLAGLPSGLPFLILFLVLIFTPPRKLISKRATGAVAVYRSWHAPTRVRLIAWGLVFLCFALAPVYAGVQLSAFAATLIFISMFAALGLVTRTSGQILLCPLAFAAVGAAAMSHLSVGWGLPWGVSLLVAGLIAVPVGMIVAVPAVRLSGVFLALATFGFGVLLANVFYTQSFMFGIAVGGIPIPRPHVRLGLWNLQSDTGFYVLLLCLATVSTGLIVMVQNGRLGRLLRGLSDSPAALEAQGTTTYITKLIVFSISAFFLGLGGALLGALYTFESGTDFSSFGSLEMVVLVTIVLVGEPWVALVAAISMQLIPSYLGASGSNYLLLLFGLVAATFSLMLQRAPSVPLSLRRFLDRVGGRQQAEGAGILPAQLPVEPVSVREGKPVSVREGVSVVRPRPISTPFLEINDLSVRFGGIRAVDGLSLTAGLAQVTGIIGPNGAGKTTMLDACCGMVEPFGGTIRVAGRDVQHMGVARRARLGMGRTFQRGELFGSLSVLENVLLGREAELAAGNPVSQVIPRRGDLAAERDAAEDAMRLVGVTELRNVQAALLSTGERRLVELARVLAGSFDLLLLDEASSGLHGGEVDKFARVVREVVDSRGVGIVLVDHDMSLVRQVCDRVYVMDFGQLIFSGSTEEMLLSEEVRSAYLGKAIPTGPAVDVAADGGSSRE
jgi:ABC-type branched-subunit amino acid transport system ATPase component/branched-subunit amino acid ABC-type transport system permease component